MPRAPPPVRQGSQYHSIRYSDRLADNEIEPSVGPVGDAYDNSLRESIIGLFKTDVIKRRGPWRRLDDVAFAVLDWSNNRRLLSTIGYIPPTEAEDDYYRANAPAEPPVGFNPKALR